MSRPPICSGCVHLLRPLFPCMNIGATCQRPLSDRRDAVNGELIDRVDVPCASERKAGRAWFGLGRERCGPAGRFFAAYQQPAPPEPLHKRRPAPKLQAVK